MTILILISLLFSQVNAKTSLPKAVQYSCGVLADAHPNHPSWENGFNPNLGPFRVQASVGKIIEDNYNNGVEFKALYDDAKDQLNAELTIDNKIVSLQSKGVLQKSMDNELGWATGYVEAKTFLTQLTGSSKTFCSVSYFSDIGSVKLSGIDYSLWCYIKTYQSANNCLPTID